MMMPLVFQNSINVFLMINKLKVTILFASLVFFTNVLSAQMTSVVNNTNATTLAQMMAGVGVTVSNAGFFGNCDSTVSAGQFYATPNTVFGLDSGVVLSSGLVTTTGVGIGVTTALGTTPGVCGAPQFATTNTNGGSDADLVTLGGGITINDACVLEFDFVPLGDTVKFDYVFGSEEYDVFNCSINDIFGFFISGPGITGPYSGPLSAANIALIPGTSFPVAISTINNGLNASPGNPCYTNTGGLGPFTNLYISNIDSFNAGIQTGMSYTGFSVTLTALAVVQPCSTYHLKLAVADASDNIYDTGVFLKAGSLSSNAISFTPISNLLNPYPYIVEGCASGFIKVTRPVATPFPYTINYQVGGVANYPTDYTVNTIPGGSPFGEVTIPAGDTVAFIAFTALQDGIAEPDEEIKIYQLAACTNDIIDSVSLFISDSIKMFIITPDTAVCREDSVHILVNGSDSLTYAWTPAISINDPTLKEPMVSPNVTTSYVVCASLPLSGCQPKCDTIEITINQPPNVFIGNDSIVCVGMSIPLNPVISPAQPYTYSWTISGPGNLSSNTTPTTTANFTNVGNAQIILNVEPQAVGCEGADTMNVQVLPNDIILLNGDTTVCQGATVQITVVGHPLFTYNWTPSTYLNNPFIDNPSSIPDTSIRYTVVATYPGCIPMTKSFEIDVQPVPDINAGIDRDVCDGDTVRLFVNVIPSTYPNYSYSWTPAVGLDNSTVQNPIFIGNTTTNYEVIVSTPIGCSDTDRVLVTVYSTEFASTTPETSTICPNDSVQFESLGGVSYVYTPGMYVNDSTIGTPVGKPLVTTTYTIYATSAQGCIDTDIVRIAVAPDAVLDAGDDVTIYPGEKVELMAGGNCSFFTWFPDYHLSNKNIANPVADPPVTTKYFVSGTTEFGCLANDSITVFVSPETILDLPNAFSPGSGTSINDELRIIKRGLATLNYYKIFNRWGQLVFQTTDINKGWDGRYNGTPQPLGSYVYIIDAQTSTGKKFIKQGNVTLIR
jgi:gliding motility-associated-like protein